MVLDLLSLQGGVMFLGRQSDTVMDADSRSGSVNGARSDQNNYTLDGLDDNQPKTRATRSRELYAPRAIRWKSFAWSPQFQRGLRAILGCAGSTGHAQRNEFASRQRL